MSERGVFCTEFIYCQDCLAAVRSIAGEYSGDVNRDGRVVFGRLSPPDSNGEVRVVELEMGPAISRLLCHDVRIAVLADGGSSAVFLVKAKGGVRMAEVVQEDAPSES